MFVYPSKLRFEGGGIRVTFSFTEITALTKESSAFLRKDALKVIKQRSGSSPDSTKKKEYFFVGVENR
jgi:hypothetical protein